MWEMFFEKKRKTEIFCFETLSKKISESKFLQKQSNLWHMAHYDDIIADKYKDFEK